MLNLSTVINTYIINNINQTDEIVLSHSSYEGGSRSIKIYRIDSIDPEELTQLHEENFVTEDINFVETKLIKISEGIETTIKVIIITNEK